MTIGRNIPATKKCANWSKKPQSDAHSQVEDGSKNNKEKNKDDIS